ncbi:hypothetical protein P691DRAFT_102556 [Macrolepiota fuliginosa MF-IS2]|uniref:Uncharacterized protein n=1 Tax=Macrolepiota fuliginosa MF-IS2 TaxID=1400762 RepID=A0A9P6C5Q9_9AGAR|nr:hypothetical protein P691DRAFT_102556 [Macrolepiota fuliginosa MF-IS2]
MLLLSKVKKILILMIIPKEPIVEELSMVESLKAIALASYLNAMLIFIPISWAFHWALPAEHPKRDILTFVFSFLALVPLVKLLGFATEELAQWVGPTLAGLLNASLKFVHPNHTFSFTDFILTIPFLVTITESNLSLLS